MTNFKKIIMRMRVMNDFLITKDLRYAFKGLKIYINIFLELHCFHLLIRELCDYLDFLT